VVELFEPIAGKVRPSGPDMKKSNKHAFRGNR